MKYADYDIVFQEVPGEVTLALNLSHCPNACKGCHSAYLMEDVGTLVDEESMEALLGKYERGITCVSFMGGDRHPFEVAEWATYLRSHHPRLKIAWYSGKQELPAYFPIDRFNFIKLGPYLEEEGPLNVPTTNQRFYRVEEGKLQDITQVFWKKK